MNLSYSTFWKVERIPGRFCDKIIEFSKKENCNFTIGGYQIRRLCWSYQNFRKGGMLNQLQCDGYPELNSDFQLVKISENPKWLKYYDSIDYDPYSELSLLKRKLFLKKIPLLKISIFNTPKETNNEFYEIYKNSIPDSLKNKTLCVDFNFTIFTKQKPFKACFVVGVSDEKNQNLRYEFIELDWEKTEWNDEKGNFKGNILVNNLSIESHNLVIYIWNIHKVPYTIGESFCQINALKTDY